MPLHLPLALLNNLTGPDLLIIGLVGLLIFGKRIPEFGKNLGRCIVEFQKNLYPQNEKNLAVRPEPAKDRMPMFLLCLLAIILALLVAYYVSSKP